MNIDDEKLIKNENNLKSFSSNKEKNSYIQSLMPDITDIDRNICPCCHAKNCITICK